MSLTEAFRDQADTCKRMGSPLMGRVLSILAKHWDATSPLGQAMAAYSGDIGPAGHSLPLRITGGLHALVLQGMDDGLIAAYPPNAADNATLEAAVLSALKTHQDFLLDWTRLPPPNQ